MDLPRMVPLQIFSALPIIRSSTYFPAPAIYVTNPKRQYLFTSVFCSATPESARYRRRLWLDAPVLIDQHDNRLNNKTLRPYQPPIMTGCFDYHRAGIALQNRHLAAYYPHPVTSSPPPILTFPHGDDRWQPAQNVHTIIHRAICQTFNASRYAAIQGREAFHFLP